MSLDMANTRVNRITRHIRINEGNSDYASIPTVTLSGDFAIHFKFASTGGGHVFASSGSTDCRLAFSATAATLDIGDVEIFGGATININITPFMNGELQSCVLRRVSGSVSLEVGGNQIGSSGASSDAVQFDSIYKQWGGATGTPNWGGVLSDFAVVDDAELVRSYPINESSGTTIFDEVLGQSGTLVNSSDDDRGLFQEVSRQGNWQGSGLTVPPWASASQIIVVA